MQVNITGYVADSAAQYVDGRIEFAQVQRIDDGELLITSRVATAQVVGGELRTLRNEPFYLPSNPEGTAVRVREMLGGETFEWWTSVPDVVAIDYHSLEPVESSQMPESVWGPPPWLAQANQTRDEIAEAVADGKATADALGGLSGINQAVSDAGDAASRAQGSAATAESKAQEAESSADRAEEAASSLDVAELNVRINEVKVTADAAASKVWVNALAVDISEYNVPVNGSTAGHTQFQAMVDALPAGSVVQGRPGQKVKFGGSVSLTKPIIIKGIEVIPNATGACFVISSDDVVLDSVTVRGTASSSYVPGQFFVTSTGSSAAPVRRSVLKNCRFYASNASAVWILWAEDFSILDCHIDGCLYSGITMISPKRGVINGNVVKNVVHVAPIVNSYGITVTDSGNDQASRAEDVVISNNIVDKVTHWEGIDTHGGQRISVIGNIVKGCRTGIAMTTGNTSRNLPANECLVVGNIIERGDAPTENAAIVFNGNSTTPMATGVIGSNVIRGYTRDLRLEYVDPVKMIVEPQATDATDRRSPNQQAYQVMTRSTTATVAAGTKEREYSLTWGPGIFTAIPTVMISKGSDVGKEFIPYTKDITIEGMKYGVYAPTNATESTTVSIKMLIMQPHYSGGGVPQP